MSKLAAGCSVVFVDIGGNRQLDALVRLLPWVQRQLRPRLMVVKSEELAAAAATQIKQQQQQHHKKSSEVNLDQQQQQQQQDFSMHDPAHQQQQQFCIQQERKACYPQQQVSQMKQEKQCCRKHQAELEMGACKLQQKKATNGTTSQQPGQIQWPSQHGLQPSSSDCGQLQQQHGGASNACVSDVVSGKIFQATASEATQIGDSCGCCSLCSECHSLTASHGADVCEIKTYPVGTTVPHAAPWMHHLQAQYGGHNISLDCREPLLSPEAWFLQAKLAGFIRNPLRYPQRYAPDGVGICRPHNYDRCKKFETCTFDHEHCHHCGQKGHKAMSCDIC